MAIPLKWPITRSASPVKELARSLRRDELTFRDWLSGKQRVPRWVPEVMRLKRMEAELRHYQMGMGKLARKLGIVSAGLITLAQPDEKRPEDNLRPPESVAVGN